MYKVIGIDEAGRGPVIGSLFIGFSIKEFDRKQDFLQFQAKLKDNGVKDSKLLSAKKRSEVYEFLSKEMNSKFVQLTPAVIDKNLGSGVKLNALEIMAIIKILEQEKPDMIIIDALTARPDKFKDYIVKRLSFECEIIAENKADLKYEMVGAASVIAKELREKELVEIRKNIGLEIGSGYPSDPVTKEFLKVHWKNSEFEFIFRKSWQTYKNVAGVCEQKKLNEFFN